MSSGVEMRKSVTVSTSASKLLTSTAQVSTNEAKPKIFSKVTVAAVCVLYKQKNNRGAMSNPNVYFMAWLLLFKKTYQRTRPSQHLAEYSGYGRRKQSPLPTP